MAASSRRNCWTQHAWRYIAIVLFVIALITATVPFSTGSSYIAGSGFFLSLIFSGWFFLGLFWNIFVVSWESCRREVMHPAAVVALDLITWLYSVVAVVFGILSVLSTASIYSNQQTYEKEGYIYRFWQLSYPQYTEGVSCERRQLSRTVTLTLSLIDGLLHHFRDLRRCSYGHPFRRLRDRLQGRRPPQEGLASSAGV